MSNFSAKVLLASLLLITVNCEYEGYACNREHDQSPGICRKVQDCPKVKEDYDAGIALTICEYINKRPIVCCPTSGLQEKISVQKCVEYAKLVKEVFIINPSMNRNSQTFSVPQCDYPKELIVGGQKTMLGEYPHMAAIGWRNFDGDLEFYCGGSLISERYVLTVAHCDEGKPLAFVRLGDQNLIKTDDGANEKDFAIDQFIKHENYTRNSKYYDIAVIKLAQVVTFSKYIRPACLWQSPNVNHTKAVASGWGYQVPYGGTSDDLMKVSLEIIKNDKCDEITPRNGLINGIIDSQICAGALEGGRDTCNGDSGGPLQVVTPENECVFHVIGLTSFGSVYCGLKNTSGVYTRISWYIDWIEQKVWG